MTPDRRVAIMTALLWTLVGAGPALGVVALLRPLPAAVADGVTLPSPGTTGLAEMAVVTHLTTLPGAAPRPGHARLAPAHPALRPADDVLDGLSTAARLTAVAAVRSVDHAATVATTPAGPGRWGVTVAVLRDGLLEGWQVTVAETPTGPLVETLPAPVALPAAAAPSTPAVTRLRPPDAEDPMAAAVAAFLDALLGGSDALDRYLAPGSDVARPSVRADRVELLRIASGPVDATRTAVLAEVRLTRPDGAVHLLHHPLLLRRDAGRWEVQRLLPALPVQQPQSAVHDDEGKQP